MRKLLPIILFFICCVAARVQAVDIHGIRVLTDRDGLPHNSVYSIFQDEKGFMWMSTANGMSRYDGNAFKNLRPDQGVWSSGSRVQRIVEDGRGLLWIKTAAGIIKYYDPGKEAFFDFDPGNKANIFDNISIVSSGDIWLWGAQGCCRISSLPEGLQVWRPGGGLSALPVNILFEDTADNLWIGRSYKLFSIKGDKVLTLDEQGPYYSVHESGESICFTTDRGIRVYDKRRAVFSFYPFPAGSDIFPRRSCLIDDGLILLSGRRDIYAFDTKTGVTASARSLFGGRQISGANYITDNAGGRWVYNLSGVLWRHRPGNTFEPMEAMPSKVLSLIESELYNIYSDSRGIVWISTFGNGLLAIDPDTGSVNHFTTGQGLPTNYLYCVTEDKSGEIWVGTDYSGVIKISLANYPVNVFYPGGEKTGDRSNAVRLIYGDSRGMFWFGTRDGELIICDSALHVLRKHRIANGMPYTVAEDTLGNKWVGSKTGEGVMIFPPDGEGTPRTVSLHDGENRVSAIDIFSILRDGKGRMWVASFGQGLFLAEQLRGELRFRRFPMRTARQNRMRGMIEASDGMIWAGSDQGVVVFNPDEVVGGSGDFISLCSDPSNPNSLNHDGVKVIFEDSQRRIWLGTAGGGLNLLVRDAVLGKSTFRHYTSKDGLNNDAVQAIEEDVEGFLWVSTESGLSKFDPRTGLFDNFFFSEAHGGDIFNERASWKKGNGELMFGSYNGVYIFDPSKIGYDRYAPSVVITGIQVNGADVVPGADGSPLTESVSRAGKIGLKHSRNSFNIEFALLNYAVPERNQYSYFLEGYEKEWNPVSGNNVALYRNVPPGEYIFRLKGSNGFGVWSDTETTLMIKISPPWWASWWAIMGYVILSAVLIYFSSRIIRRMNRLNTAVVVEKQLTEHKLRFFTNISHEFRTPLTIMRGSVENLSEEENLPATARKYVDSLSKSSGRLLRLIDQLLEFRSIQNSVPKLQLQQTEIVAFFKAIYDEFRDMADAKQIDFSFDADLPQCDAMLDRDKMEKIVYNLLSNAFKNTPAGGKIVLKLERSNGDGFTLSLSDSGKGIPSDKRDMLFKRFARINDTAGGTGIGLHLVSELAALHRARVEYSESDMGGACFSLYVPLLEETKDIFSLDAVDEVITSDYAEESTALRNPLGEYKIALIEDDDEIRELLEEQLGKNFAVVSADDGDRGLELVLKEQPDLILCDVMMPGMNGFEITKRLKDNFETSHIPIVLLTAHTSEEHRLAGVRTGADAYIAKPFSLKYLFARIVKLIEQREKLQDKFTREPGLLSVRAELTDKDALFLDKLHISIEKNLNNPEFTVDSLLKEMSISRTAFYQKVKGVTGHAPNEYLRIIRLKQAAELLKRSEHNVSEISYLVGFDNPFYFSKCFKDHFGKTPSQYKKG